jgi:hypothetical protein
MQSGVMRGMVPLKLSIPVVISMSSDCLVRLERVESSGAGCFRFNFCRKRITKIDIFELLPAILPVAFAVPVGTEIQTHVSFDGAAF